MAAQPISSTGGIDVVSKRGRNGDIEAKYPDGPAAYTRANRHLQNDR